MHTWKHLASTRVSSAQPQLQAERREKVYLLQTALARDSENPDRATRRADRRAVSWRRARQQQVCQQLFMRLGRAIKTRWLRSKNSNLRRAEAARRLPASPPRGVYALRRAIWEFFSLSPRHNKSGREFNSSSRPRPADSWLAMAIIFIAVI